MSDFIPTPEQMERLTGASMLSAIGDPMRVDGLPDPEYRNAGGSSYSTLKKMSPRPANIASVFTDKDESHFKIGRFVHQAILTPQVPFPHFVIKPEVLGVDKDGKPWKWNGNRNDCKAWVAGHESAGRLVFSQDDHETTTGCITSLAKHPVISQVFAEGSAEVSLFRKRSLNGAEFIDKARVDWAPDGSEALGDIKTVAPGRMSDRDIRNLIKFEGLGIQAAKYLDDWNACNPNDQRTKWFWVFVEKCPPYCVELVYAEWDYLDQFRNQLHQLLETYSRSISKGRFDGDAVTFRNAQDFEKQ